MTYGLVVPYHIGGTLGEDLTKSYIGSEDANHNADDNSEFYVSTMLLPHHLKPPGYE